MKKRCVSPLSLAFVSFFSPLNRSQLTLISFFRKPCAEIMLCQMLRVGSRLSRHTLEPCLSSSPSVRFLQSSAPFTWPLEVPAGLPTLPRRHTPILTLGLFFSGGPFLFFTRNLKPSPRVPPPSPVPAEFCCKSHVYSCVSSPGGRRRACPLC